MKSMVNPCPCLSPLQDRDSVFDIEEEDVGLALVEGANNRSLITKYFALPGHEFSPLPRSVLVVPTILKLIKSEFEFRNM